LAAGMDYRRILHFGWFYYFVAIAALLAVRFMGDTGGGAQRWVTIGPLRFQPSEMAKVLLILFYAFFINKYKERIRTAPVTLMGIALIVPALILVISQPDLSTTIMIFIIFCVIMFVGGINWKLVVGVLVVSIPSVAVLFNMILQDTEGKIIDTYQRNRILAWIYPDQYQDSYAYQTINSVMAIGSGRLLGKGYNTNEISSLLNSGYISESQTDFIFAVIGEEFGFLGTCIVVLLVFLIALRILRIAMKASDVSGRVIAAGMAAWIGFQGFMNIAVAVGLIPNTGIPLPFVSYGLTSLLSLYLGVGFVLNVYMQSRKR
ncbi:MAG: FtsW/RodA/SpoVE family cell cycle protein, partial [Lachnospiraceae bacterium]|nr:FtsW/RodA/SpoVE family cell cycle protein [Lachnospiraceae bacterium]